MRLLPNRILFLILIAGLPVGAMAQIFPLVYSYIDTTVYPQFRAKDPVIVINLPCRLSTTPTTSLIARYPGNPDSCTFQWAKYNTSTGAFDIPVQNDALVTQSQANGLGEGGYQVHISRSGLPDTTFRAWIYYHHFSVSVLKTTEGKLPGNKYTCEYLDLSGSFRTDTFVYYDPSNGKAISLPNSFETWWSSVNDAEFVNKLFSELNVRTYNPPVYDTHYTLKVTDRFGDMCSDTVLYESIQTKARFIYKFHDITGDTKGYVDMNGSGESAPATFQFINQSVNGAEFEWWLVDSTFTYGQVIKPVITTDTSEKPEYTYTVPRQYTIRLISRSAEHCVDTAISDNPIIIRNSELKVPNVFTPNGDGVNDNFVIYSYDDETSSGSYIHFASIRNFHISIYSRWGMKVHEFEGDINQWLANGGWDGKIQGTNRDAAPGVYYYIIVATGYDNAQYKGQNQTKGPDGKPTGTPYMGIVYLIR